MTNKNYKILMGFLWALIAVLALLNLCMGLSYWQMKHTPAGQPNMRQIYQEYLGDLSG